MCGVRRCWSSVGLLLFALLGVTTSSHAGRSKQHDSLHWVAKAQVTAHPLDLLKRDDAVCSTGLNLCPPSLGGGCCPSQYECHTDSCYATTAGPQTACGLANHHACPVEDSGGCCPLGLICRPTGCIQPAGVTSTYTSCPFNYFLCPQSVNFGCCMNGMGCGFNECYTTTPVTSTVIQVITTTSGRDTITTTRTAVTVATPTPPSGTPTNDNFVPKFMPTSVAKMDQIPSKSSDSGLTTAQLGGIVGGVVALLLIVVVATVLIIRHLKRVTDAVESRKDASSGGRTKESQSQARIYGGHLHITQGDDNQSIDPLMVTPNTNTNPGSGSGTGTPQIGGGLRDRSDSELGFSPLQKARGDSVDASGRHTSIDSNPAYFDLPPRVANVPGARPQMNVRGSADTTGQYSQYTYTHWRQTSNASELSGDGSENGGGLGSPLVPELDASGAYAELPGVDHEQNGAGAGNGNGGRSRSGSGVASPRVSFGQNRRRSESNGQRTEPPSAAAASASASAGFSGPLDVVSESTEIMHGYYGPDKQAGQTAAGLNVGWDISSPVAAAQPLPQAIMIPTHPVQAQSSLAQHPQDQQPLYPQEQQQQQPHQYAQDQQPQYPQEQLYQYQQQPQQQYTPGQLQQQYQFPQQPEQQQQQHHTQENEYYHQQQQQSPQPKQYPYPPQPTHPQ